MNATPYLLIVLGTVVATLYVGRLVALGVLIAEIVISCIFPTLFFVPLLLWQDMLHTGENSALAGLLAIAT
jgi:hypothetical protein